MTNTQHKGGISTSHFFHYSEMDNTYAHKMWVAEHIAQAASTAAATKHTKKDKMSGSVRRRWRGWMAGGVKVERWKIDK